MTIRLTACSVLFFLNLCALVTGSQGRLPRTEGTRVQPGAAAEAHDGVWRRQPVDARELPFRRSDRTELR